MEWVSVHLCQLEDPDVNVEEKEHQLCQITHISWTKELTKALLQFPNLVPLLINFALNGPTLRLKENAILTLRNLAYVEENQIALLQNNPELLDLTYFLVKNGESSKIRQHTLRFLTRLGMAAENIVQLTNFPNLFNSVYECIFETDLTAKENALMFFVNLGFNGVKLNEIKPNFVVKMFDCLQFGETPEIRENGAWALMNISYNKKKILIEEENSIRILLDVCKSGATMKTKESAMASLLNSSCEDDNREVLYNYEELVPFALSTLLEPSQGKNNRQQYSPIEQDHAMGLLVNLTNEAKLRKSFLIKHPQFIDVMIHSIKFGAMPSIQETALGALVNLSDCVENRLTLFQHEKFVETITNITKIGSSANFQLYCEEIIQNLSFYFDIVSTLNYQVLIAICSVKSLRQRRRNFSKTSILQLLHMDLIRVLGRMLI